MLLISNMLVAQELVNKIKDYFNLNVYETKVWLALLGKGVSTAGEIAEISGVPRSRTYDVLEGIEKKGFAITKLGKPVKYIGVKPKMVLERMKHDVKQTADEKISSLVNIKGTEEFAKLESLYNEGTNPIKREDISAAIKGKSNISNYLREIIQNASKEVIICTSAEEIKSKLKLFQQTFEILSKNKIKINLALSGDAKVIDHLRKTLNVKIKQIEIDAKFFIIDRTEILFYLSKNTDKEDNAIWLNSDFFSESFALLFEKALEKEK